MHRAARWQFLCLQPASACRDRLQQQPDRNADDCDHATNAGKAECVWYAPVRSRPLDGFGNIAWPAAGVRDHAESEKESLDKVRADLDGDCASFRRVCGLV